MTQKDEKLLSGIGRALADAIGTPETGRYCVALSGGLDSTVLLAAMSRLARGWPGAGLRALHVDHRLHRDATRWAALAGRQAALLDVPFESVTLDKPPGGPKGLEAEARHARYAALSENLRNGEVLLCAHHADDQLETVLLQLLRGAGPAGLSAMPLSKAFGKGCLVRPMLGLSRQDIADYATRHGLSWSDDPGNVDERHARNYLRHRVLPSLLDRWPEGAANVSRSALLSAEAESLLRELGGQDARRAGDDGTLDLKVLRQYSAPRVRNALRIWIGSAGHVVPGYATMHEICTQVLNAGSGSSPAFEWEGAELRVYRNRLYLMSPLPAPPAAPITWTGSDPLVLPGGLGQLELESAGEARHAIAEKHLDEPLIVRFRCGGDQFKPAGGHTRTIKKWLQDMRVPPWQRNRWPLVCLADAIAWVPGLGPAAQFEAESNENARIVRWQRPATGTPAFPD